MKGRKRLIQGALLLGAIALTTAACGQKEALVGTPASTSQPDHQASTQVSASPTPATTPDPMKQAKVKVYYSDANEMQLVEKEVEISYKQDNDLYQKAFEALKQTDDPTAVSLFGDVAFKSVAMDKSSGELKLDLSFGDNAQLGAPGEELFLQALKKTAFQFMDVKALYVLKDGKQVESLMGHMDLPYPIKRTK